MIGRELIRRKLTGHRPTLAQTRPGEEQMSHHRTGLVMDMSYRRRPTLGPRS